MDVTQFTMPADAAQEKFEAYREQLKKKHTKIDEDLCRAYQAMAKGTPVIDLLNVMKEAGEDEAGYPVLGITQADAGMCYFRPSQDGSGVFYWTSKHLESWQRKFPQAQTKRIVLPPNTFSHYEWTNRREEKGAIVPLVPADLRPSQGLHLYHILFEAEWRDVPPVDPFLLKRLGGPGSNLFAVLAHWDLTEIERAVLARHIVGGN